MKNLVSHAVKFELMKPIKFKGFLLKHTNEKERASGKETVYVEKMISSIESYDGKNLLNESI